MESWGNSCCQRTDIKPVLGLLLSYAVRIACYLSATITLHLTEIIDTPTTLLEWPWVLYKECKLKMCCESKPNLSNYMSQTERQLRPSMEAKHLPYIRVSVTKAIGSPLIKLFGDYNIYYMVWGKEKSRIAISPYMNIIRDLIQRENCCCFATTFDIWRNMAKYAGHRPHISMYSNKNDFNVWSPLGILTSSTQTQK